ncbi:MAG TPA: hypothetical protein VKQ34_02910 [Candidatus Saccharimonadales bacterium]|nr:hypothetical protein [Candidatus Saccharimonadales bacterium]
MDIPAPTYVAATDFQTIVHMIHNLEHAAAERKVTHELLDHYQTRLDEYAVIYQHATAVGSQRAKLYELQALLLHLGGDQQKALTCLNQARMLMAPGDPFVSSIAATLSSVQVAPKPVHRKKRDIKKWIVLIAAPFAMVILVIIFLFISGSVNGGSAALGETPSAGAIVLNVISIIIGILAVVDFMLLPLWIIFLVQDIANNKHIASGGVYPLKNKTAAIVFAAIFGFWAWVYTYQKDAWKFWLNLVLNVLTFGFFGIASWIWSLIDLAVHPEEWYAQFR